MKPLAPVITIFISIYSQHFFFIKSSIVDFEIENVFDNQHRESPNQGAFEVNRP
jgi:hypothetical protein